MTTAQSKFLVNGIISSSLPVTDRGLQFGDGVFETIRIHEGHPVWWQQHIDRLLDGCSRLCFHSLPDPALLQQEAVEMAAGVDAGVLKIIITRGCSLRGYAAAPDMKPNRILMLKPGQRHADKSEQGITLGICKQRLGESPSLVGIKHLNRLEQVLARMQCQEQEWDEGLMLDQQEQVIEGSMSNIFIWQNQRLITPSLALAGIPGICRQRILDLAVQYGIKTEQRELVIEDMVNCDGIFVSNSLIGIWPVSVFNYSGSEQKKFPINNDTRVLQQQLEADLCLAG